MKQLEIEWYIHKFVISQGGFSHPPSTQEGGVVRGLGFRPTFTKPPNPTLWELFQQKMASVRLRVGFCSFTLRNSVCLRNSLFLNFDHSFPIERSYSIICGIPYNIICKEIAKILPKFYIKLQFCFISLV